MRAKTLMTLAVVVAVIAAAISAVVVSMNKSNEARAKAEAAVAKADAAEAKAREAERLEAAERTKKVAAEAKQKAEAAALESAKIANETAKAEERTAEENRKAKEAEATAAKAEAEKARAVKETAALKLKTAREEKEKAAKQAETEAHKAQAEADKLAAEKAKGERIVAEAKAMELRQIDFQTMERELNEWKRDLEEREAALTPEKTIADLSWVGGDDELEVGSNGTVRVKVKVPYLPENDKALPHETRKLAKAERIMAEKSADHAAQTREKVVGSIEKLYVQALKKGDVILADYYRQNLKSLYPDWEFKGEKREVTK